MSLLFQVAPVYVSLCVCQLLFIYMADEAKKQKHVLPSYHACSFLLHYYLLYLHSLFTNFRFHVYKLTSQLDTSKNIWWQFVNFAAIVSIKLHLSLTISSKSTSNLTVLYRPFRGDVTNVKRKSAILPGGHTDPLVKCKP